MAKKTESNGDHRPTHALMRHPRQEGDRNIPVEQTRDDGNGAGEYKTADGDTITVVMKPLSPNPKDNAPDGPELYETDEKARPRGRVSILRVRS